MSREGRGRWSAGVLAPVLVGLLVGCGAPEANPLDLPTMSGAGSSAVALNEPSASAGGAGSTATGAASSTSAGWNGGVFGKGASAQLGVLTGSARAHPSLVRLVVDYWDTRVKIGNTWRIDESALQQVASGRAASQARKRADTLSTGQRHVVGKFVVNASQVKVSGSTATVTGCMQDWTSEVDPAGQIVIDAPGGRVTTLQLTRTGSTWRVSDVPHDVPPFCSQDGTKVEVFGSPS
ncbi:hypothetical protein ACIB24_07585 [Spongisporangium articulatum]|uniref:Lipoprotein n=1 Tax=Spongisporangium articulatum TaxID=3362603 RepID=A0ABW8AKN8_9ACTN